MASMAGQSPNRVREEELTLRSQIAELSRVPPWIEGLASETPIPEQTQFAMNLCLEEILSNIIRHGYGNRPDGSIRVRYAPLPGESWRLVVEDEAPHFNPLGAKEMPGPATLAETQVGGLGLRLVRNFAKNLSYEPTDRGNRLTMEFSAAGEVK